MFSDSGSGGGDAIHSIDSNQTLGGFFSLETLAIKDSAPSYQLL